jgi:DNA-binding transcriptional ArsR family regulator
MPSSDELFPGHDAARDVVLTPSAMRGLVHPIRLRLLDLLQADGPATATGLGDRIGQSSGVTSYHLRVLADHGFVVEETDRGNGRDRWWRAVHRSTSFSFRVPGDPGSSETVEQAEQFIRLNAEESHRRVLAYIDTLPSHVDELADMPWTVSDWPLYLTAEEAFELATEVRELVLRHRRDAGSPTPGPGVIKAHAQFQLFPEET